VNEVLFSQIYLKLRKPASVNTSLASTLVDCKNCDCGFDTDDLELDGVALFQDDELAIALQTCDLCVVLVKGVSDFYSNYQSL
jgi:hypothetical protein